MTVRDEVQGARSAGTEAYIEICRGYEHRATQQIARTSNKSAFPYASHSFLVKPNARISPDLNVTSKGI